MEPIDSGTLEDRAAAVGLTLAPALQERLLVYARLVEHWDLGINLVSFATAADAVDRLLIEPVVAVGALPPGPQRVVDIGSGAGSPALPMHLARPESSWRLVESREKKATFLRVAASELGLAGVEVDTRRAEALARAPETAGAHDVLTVRAVRLTTPFLAALAPLVRPEGLWLFFGTEGDPPPLPASWRLIERRPLIESSRSVLSLARSA